MLVITGAAGFIGGNLIQRLNQENFNSIIAVDKFDTAAINKTIIGSKIKEQVDVGLFFDWLDKNYETVEFIFHLSARTDTTESDLAHLNSFYTAYTKSLWNKCCQYQIPFIYASPEAASGLGEFGSDDDQSKISLLKPVHHEGLSKQEFDVWALQQPDKPFFWAGLKFLNVEGLNENHQDGEKKLKFVYVKDVATVCMFFMHHRKNSGIYILQSGMRI